VSTSLYVSNLPFTVTEKMLAWKFGKFGTVLSVKLKRAPETGHARCHGFFVEMKTQAQARNAEIALHATPLEGQLMSVNRTVRG